MVSSFADLFNDSLTITHNLNNQFVTKKKKFRVLGKAAAMLGEHSYVSPMTFAEGVDFEFIGLKSLHTLGTRATAMMKFLEVSMPFIQMQPGLFNVPLAIQDLYNEIVGVRLAEDIMRAPTPLDQLLPPQHENLMLADGQQVDVDAQDDHTEHILSHTAARTRFEAMGTLTPDGDEAMVNHIMAHVMEEDRLAVQRQAANQSNQILAGGNQLQQQPQTLPQNGQGDMGNPGQATTPQGESAGPQSQFKVATPGRNPTMDQSTNQARMRSA
jgi:hypothetical protein